MEGAATRRAHQKAPMKAPRTRAQRCAVRARQDACCDGAAASALGQSATWPPARVPLASPSSAARACGTCMRGRRGKCRRGRRG
eukprot:6203607-Pleurochrysis_carterae.AAC.1